MANKKGKQKPPQEIEIPKEDIRIEEGQPKFNAILSKAWEIKK